MSPAELKSHHEALGLTADFLAERMGVTVVTVWKYERPDRTTPVPAKAAGVMHDLLDARQSAIERAEHLFDFEGWFPRFISAEKWHSQFPELAGWPGGAQGPFVAAVMERYEIGSEYV